MDKRVVNVRMKLFWGALVSLLAACSYFFSQSQSEPIKVGILHSQTGALSSVEVPVTQAALLAINEINQAGGLLGRQIKPIIVDAKSNLQEFYKQAERLILQEKVSVVFGCFTSASRKTVKPVIEKYNNLLIYPTQYEGLEESPNIVYMGAAPNQQTLPGVLWCFENLGKKFYLVGSDYIYPRIVHEIIRDHIRTLGGTIVGEQFIKLGSTHVEHIVKEIIKTKPQVILNNLVGKDNNEAFFRALEKAGISSSDIPVMSFVIGESDFLDINVSLNGNYCAWNYMQTIPTQMNLEFVARYKKKYGADKVIGDIMEAEYAGVYVWAQAVKKMKSVDSNIIKEGIKGQSWYAPEGTVSIERANNHTWKNVRIGKIGHDKQFIIVWDSRKPIQPIPFPIYRTRETWQKTVQDFYTSWGNKWENQ